MNELPQRLSESHIRAALLQDGIKPRTVEKFLTFHHNCPWAWRGFEKLALQAISEGHEHWSADGIGHVLRWDVRNKKYAGETFKLNNNYMSCMSRVFAMKYPHRASFFFFRETKGQQHAA